MVFVYVFGGLLGLCIGSFLNVVIYRLPNGMSLATPPSHCPNCGYRLKWYDNIPVLSYIILGGKCRKCKEHISFRYTVVELGNTVMWLACILCFWERSIPVACLTACACSVLLCMANTDLEHQIVPDSLQIALTAIAVAVTVLDPAYPWYSHLIGAAAFGFVFWLVSFFFQKKTDAEAMGGADIKLAFAAGLLLGWQKMLFAMLVASVAGSIILLAIRKKHQDEKGKTYPFVPFMAGGIYAAVFFGEMLFNGYMDLLTSFVR